MKTLLRTFTLFAALTLLVPMAPSVLANEPPPKKTEDPAKPEKKTSKQDGLSFETAIVIKAKTTDKGVAAEYAWLRKNFPGHTVLGQSVQLKDGKHYDVINIRLKNDTEKKIHFDITSFFGKH